MATDKTTLKNWFKTGLKPTQAQFWAWMDSYWHKDEQLAIANVANLGNLLDGKADTNHAHAEYATNDAISLNAQNIVSWKQALGIDNLEMIDTSVTTTVAYDRFGLPIGSSIQSLNNKVFDELEFKLTKPTENATADYVLLGDGTTAAKSEFGKVDTVMGVTADPVSKNIDISAIATNWSNPSQRFSGLADKSADATFNQFALFDNNGNLAKSTKPLNAFKNFLNLNTQAENLELGQLLNGGQGSSGAISVNLISPPIIQNRFDSVEYILLRGANLLLNSTDMSISICDENRNVIQQIPSNQIINNSATELIFYYNFHNFTIGSYIIKITSGVKVFYTTLDLKVVSEVQDVNINSIIWERVIKEDIPISPQNSAVGSSFILSSLQSEGSVVPVVSYKSSEIFNEGEDFYLEIKITLPSTVFNSVSHPNSIRANIGIGYSNTENSLVNKNLVFTQAFLYAAAGVGYTNNTTLVKQDFGPFTYSLIIIKTGNLFRTIVDTTTQQVTLSNNSGYSIFLEMPNFLKEYTIQGQVVKAFKFN